MIYFHVVSCFVDYFVASASVPAFLTDTRKIDLIELELTLSTKLDYVDR
jgi:hypothetical protein